MHSNEQNAVIWKLMEMVKPKREKNVVIIGFFVKTEKKHFRLFIISVTAQIQF